MRIPKLYTLTVIGGFVVGLLFGDHVFPEFEAVFGDPTTDIVLGVLCAIIASLIYEIVVHLREMP
jgi:4-hydroxybenzoate polyprenyltransferase